MNDRKSLQDTGQKEESWSQPIHQILTPVQILTDSELQQEMDYFTGTQQFRYNQNYFEQRRQPYQNTPQLNIPVNAEDYVISNANNASFSNNFKPKRVAFDRNPSHEGSLVLNHESGMYADQHPKYSNQSTPINSTPASPISNTYDSNYYNPTSQQPDKFASMFLSSNVPDLLVGQKQPKKNTKLNSLLLSKHNQEQEKISEKKKKVITAVKSTAESKKKKKKRSTSDNEEEEEEEEEDEPVIGDGAQSYSSMGSNSSKTSLTKDDKRRRNTAASARFRIKKKMREQALQNTACEMTDKAKLMEQRVHELEREIKWLKALVVEKNEARLEQLVREKPAKSIAFPSYNSSSNNEYEEEDDEDYTYRY